MTQTIQLEKRTVTAIQAIWDHDHGTENEGWYLRVRYEDSGDEDDSNCPIRDMDKSATDAEIRSQVKSWLFDVDGMTDQAQQDLHDMIEVKR